MVAIGNTRQTRRFHLFAVQQVRAAVTEKTKKVGEFLRGAFGCKPLVFHCFKAGVAFYGVFDGLHEFFSSHFSRQWVRAPLPGCAALVPRYYAGFPPALGREMHARTAAQIARGRRRVLTCQRAGAGVRGGLSHALPPGRLMPEAVRLPDTHIIPQFALLGNGGNGLFYGVYGGLRLLGCGLLCIL